MANPSQLFADWQADPKNSVLPDFSRAGFGEGDQLTPVVPDSALPVFHVDDFGATPDDGVTDRMAIQQAIDAAAFAGGGIVKFSAGTYEISANNTRSFYPLFVRSSNIILRGEDPAVGTTRLYAPNLMRDSLGYFATWGIVNVVAPDVWGFEITYGDDEGQPPMQNFHPYLSTTEVTSDEDRLASGHFYVNPAKIIGSLTADAPIKSTELTVDRPENFAPGDLVIIVMRSADAAAKLIAPNDPSGFVHLTWPDANLVRQIVTVESVSGNVVTIAEELRWDYEVQYGVDIVPWHHIENVGIEDMVIEAGTRFDSIVEKWKPNAARAVSITNVRNGWLRNIVAINVSGFGALSACKNVTVVDSRQRVTQEGPLEFGGSGFHNSFKFLGHTCDSLMERCIIEDPTDHGFAIQRHANGNVFLHCEDWWPENELDIHSQIPMSNLYDNLTGAEEGGWGGNIRTQPHAAPLNVLWNWNSTIDSLLNLWQGNGEFQPQMAMPIIVGLTSSRGNPPNVQFLPSSFSGVYLDPQNRVIAESLGTNVTPESLYLAQVDHRRGQPREPGIFLAIDGPRGVQTGQSYQWDASASTGNSLTFTWRVNGGPDVTGPVLTHTFTEVGPHEISLRAESPTGARNWRTFKVFASDPAGFFIEPLGSSRDLVGWGMLDTGRLWYTWTNPIRYGNPVFPGRGVGFVNADQNTGAPTGGYLLTHLPDEGLDIANANYAIELDINVTKNNPLFRILVADTDGDWAMSTSQLSDGNNAGSVSGLSWTAPHPDFNLQAGLIDLDNITRFGVVLYWASGSFFGNGNDLAHLRGQGIQLTAASVVPNLAPEVELTAPSGGELLPFGFPVTLVADATDPDGSIDEVRFLADGILIHTDDSAPFTFDWSPAAPGTFSIRAEAIDDLGATTTSDAASITVTEDNFLPDVTLTAPSGGETYTLGELVNFAATADDLDGTIARVEFLVDGAIVGTSLVPPYQFAWMPSAGGVIELSARAVDDEDGTDTSPAVSITVIDPANDIPDAVLTHPFDGAQFEFSAEVVLDAHVTDPDSAITSVRFLADGSEIASFSAPPYRAVWSPDAGTYELTIEATDSENATGVSRPVTITILGGSSEVLEIVAEADTYAHRGDSTPDNSAEVDLEVQQGGRQAYFRFPLAAALGLNVVDVDFRFFGGTRGEQQLNLTSDGWVDSAVNWDNRPGIIAPIGGEFSASGPNDRDVTAEFLAELSGDQTLSLALTSSTFGVTEYKSIEVSNPDQRPCLLVTHLTADAIETFADWLAETFPGESDPALTDPDVDGLERGVPNILAYTTGWTEDESSSLLSSSVEGAEWVLRFTRAPATSRAWTRLEISVDGTSFTPAPVTPVVIGTDADGREIVEVRLPLDEARGLGRLNGGLFE